MQREHRKMLHLMRLEEQELWQLLFMDTLRESEERQSNKDAGISANTNKLFPYAY